MPRPHAHAAEQEFFEPCLKSILISDAWAARVRDHTRSQRSSVIMPGWRSGSAFHL